MLKTFKFSKFNILNKIKTSITPSNIIHFSKGSMVIGVIGGFTIGVCKTSYDYGQDTHGNMNTGRDFLELPLGCAAVGGIIGVAIPYSPIIGIFYGIGYIRKHIISI
jgi:hypothetical protein